LLMIFRFRIPSLPVSLGLYTPESIQIVSVKAIQQRLLVDTNRI